MITKKDDVSVPQLLKYLLIAGVALLLGLRLFFWLSGNMVQMKLIIGCGRNIPPYPIMTIRRSTHGPFGPRQKLLAGMCGHCA